MSTKSKISQAENREILRSNINLASYNPRSISEDARRRLKANLKRVGVLGGIVWNENTGNLVSGHQKISIIDELNDFVYETNENDYVIKVDVAHLTDKEEKEQNIFMNSRSAQGFFNEEMMKDLLVGIDYKFAGLDEIDLAMFDIEIPDINISPNTPVWSEDTKENQIARKSAIAFHKQRVVKERDGNDRGAESYVCVTFSNSKEKELFLLRFGYDPYEQFIKGEDFNEIIERID